MLQLRNVCKTYRSKKGADCKALNDVSLTLGEKGLYFLLGKSGSGKSTLLNIIGGLDKADSGEILYNAQSLSGFSANDLDNYRNVTVGFVFQEFNLLEQFNLYENIELVLKMQKLDFTPQEIENALERVGMQGYGKRAVSELSGGQKQRVAIARALLKQSKIILADEPTGNLDSETSAEIFELLKDISQEKLVIVVTHDRESAEKYGDGIVEIKDGEIVKNNLPQTESEVGSDTKIIFEKHKIPFVYKLRMALKNFGKHWVRLSVTAVALTVALGLLGVSQICLSLDTEKAIATTYVKNKANLFSLGTFEKGDYPSMSSVASSSVSAKAFQYLNENGIPYLKHTSNGYDGVETIYADSAEELNQFGLMLYDGYLPLDDSSVYCTDYWVNRSFVEFGKSCKWEDGSENVSFDQMAGKTLLRDYGGQDGVVRYKIAGVIKTGYENHSDWNEDDWYDNDFWNMQDIRRAIVKKVPEIARQDYIWVDTVDFKTTQQSMDFTVNGEVHSFIKEEILHNVYTQVPDLRTLKEVTVYSATDEDGEKSITLSNSDVVLGEKLYERLFEKLPDRPEYSENYDEYRAQIVKYYKELGEISARHIGETIDISYMQTDVGEDLLGLKGKKFAGLLNRNDFCAYVAEGEIENHLSDNFYLYEKYGVLVGVKDYKTTKKMLTDLHYDCNVGVYSNYPFYSSVASIENSTRIPMILIVTLSSSLVLLLLIGMVYMNVKSRQKEIGIFKALGCRNSDVKIIFLLEVMIIGVVSMVLSIAGLYTLVYFLNIYNGSFVMRGFTLYFVDWLTWLICAAYSFGVTWIVSYLPLVKISKMRPVDAIRNL